MCVTFVRFSSKIINRNSHYTAYFTYAYDFRLHADKNCKKSGALFRNKSKNIVNKHRFHII